MIVYDLEIVKAIQKKGETRIEGIEYCNGWNDHANMGISVLCAYDYRDGRFRVFTSPEPFRQFVDADGHVPLVSFNGINFDSKVLWECWKIDTLHHPQYDILREMWSASGLNPNEFNFGTHNGFGLDATADINRIGHKSGHGALAPVQWQQGKVGEVIDYCLEDVRLTKAVMDKILYTGGLTSPKTGEFLRLPRPR